MFQSARHRRHALLATVALSAVVASGGSIPSASAATPSPVATPSATSPTSATGALPPGLFGTTDPRSDGVRRQGLAIMALSTAGFRVGEESVTVLTDQQCADGGFTAWRTDTSVPCGKSREDVRVTAFAMEGLSAAKNDRPEVALELARAADWIRGTERADGGFGQHPGAVADSISTGRALSGLAAANQEGGYTATGETGRTFLERRQVLCADPDPDKRGGFTYSAGSGSRDEVSATAWATLGLLPEALPAQPVAARSGASPIGCPPTELTNATDEAHRAAANGAWYLTQTLDANNGTLPARGGGVDYAGTVAATIALASTGFAKAEQKAVADYFKSNSNQWIRGRGGADEATPLAELTLLAYSTGQNSRSFGGTDLIDRLRKTEVGGVHSEHRPTRAPGNPVNRKLILFLLVAALLVAAVAAAERHRRLRPSEPTDAGSSPAGSTEASSGETISLAEPSASETT